MAINYINSHDVTFKNFQALNSSTIFCLCGIWVWWHWCLFWLSNCSSCCQIWSTGGSLCHV